MKLPKVGMTPTEKLGVAEVSTAVFRPVDEGGLGFIYRNVPEVDVGVDGHIEIVNAAREATGKFVGVQIKAGQSWFKSRTSDGWLVPIDHRGGLRNLDR